jgi:hypothetical protein
MTKWNRDTIIDRSRTWVEGKGELSIRDLRKENGLPSLTTVMRNFPEFGRFSEFQRLLGVFKEQVRWKADTAVEAGRQYVESHDGVMKATDLNQNNGLPSLFTVVKLFGSVKNFQKQVGAQISSNNQKTSLAEVDRAVETYFEVAIRQRRIDSKTEFFSGFAISRDVVVRAFGNVDNFLKHYGIDSAKQ